MLINGHINIFSDAWYRNVYSCCVVEIVVVDTFCFFVVVGTFDDDADAAFLILRFFAFFDTCDDDAWRLEVFCVVSFVVDGFWVFRF